MADDLQIRIELDRDPPRFEPGDTITGTLHIRAQADTEARKVWVRRVYRTQGRGATDMGGSERVVLDDETRPLRTGDERSYRFELTAPDGPPTQAGELVALEWIVQAGVDVPGRKDPYEAVVFELADTVVPPDAKESPSDPEGQLRYVKLADLPTAEADRIRSIPAVEWMPIDRSGERRKRWFQERSPRAQGCLKTCWGCLWAPFVLIPLMPLLIGIGFIRDGSYGLGGVLIIIALAFITVGVVSADRYTGGGIRRWFSERMFGAFSLKAALDDLHRGGPVVWFVQLEPRRSLSVRRAHARLELEERMRTRRRSNDSSGTIRHVADEQTFTLDESLHVERGEEVLLAGNLTLPTSWPASVYGNSEFRWTLHVDLELDSGPDWHGQVRIDVR